MNNSIVIVSAFLAPYRLSLYQRVNERLNEAKVGTVTLIYGQTQQLDHAWSNLLGPTSFNAKLISCFYLPRWCQRALRFFKIGKGNPAFGGVRIYRYLKQLDPSIVWLCEYGLYTLPALFYAKLYGKKCWVATDVGSTTLPGDANISIKVIHFVCSLFVDGVIAHTPHAMRPFGDVRHTTIFAPHAVCSGEYVNFCKRHKGFVNIPKIIFVGNCIERKGVDLLFRAFKVLLTKSIKFELRLVGGGDANWIKKLESKLGLEGAVHYSDFVQGEALKREYSHADIFVLPSRNDTYGVVVHEAAICGLPLIVSKYAGSHEVLVKNGENGYVIDPFDVEQFADKLRLLITSSELRKQFGSRSVEIADQWDVDKSAWRILRAMKII